MDSVSARWRDPFAEMDDMMGAMMGGGLMESFFGGDMFERHDRMMDQMMRGMGGGMRPSNSGATFSYSSSSYVSSHGSGGQPVVVQRTVQHSRAGGAAETKEFFQDSRSGTERMKIQRRLGNRARTITKSRDARGNEESEDRIDNMTDADLSRFDEEWRTAASQRMLTFGSGDGGRRGRGDFAPHGLPSHGSHRREPVLALPAYTGTEEERHEADLGWRGPARERRDRERRHRGAPSQGSRRERR
eukprot:CAMPEP_0196770616 /NCGR_PEP_ID=MMETSP1104-20130614/1240_1 /TAXON_ID=33652 /ORGANISM="Cafeteria sp., Strain Caron Lab Isolate" /LENGTH=244 /DNA_ID=CAMNT_0042140733 /DNA_START=1 /DNA_END=732 /DNA_ORIENTATION=+